jgi:monoterpene epsilon-lactone hydrolase
MPSLGARAFTWVLRLIRRNRSLASSAALSSGIAQARSRGPVLPSPRLRKRLRVSEQDIDGHRVYTLAPAADIAGSKHVLYLHGGAFVRSITGYHWRFLQHLVETSGCTVTVPLYPLAPEHCGLEALGFALKVYDRVAQTVAPEALVMMGDSAGGNLALTTTLALRDRSQPLPHGLVLIAPVADVSLIHPDISAIEPLDPMLATPGLQEAGRLYAGDIALDDPYISPLHAQLSGLPPMTIYAGTHDILYPDIIALADKARRQGTEVELIVGPEMIHVWPILPFAEGYAARNHIAARVAG